MCLGEPSTVAFGNAEPVSDGLKVEPHFLLWITESYCNKAKRCPFGFAFGSGEQAEHLIVLLDREHEATR